MTTDEAKRRLEVTGYLQLQLTLAHKEVDVLEDEISTMEAAKCWGTKLTSTRYRLEYWKGRRDTLQEMWDFRGKGAE